MSHTYAAENVEQDFKIPGVKVEEGGEETGEETREETEKRLHDSLDSQRTLTESCQNKAKELEARQNRLSAGVQDIEKRMNRILSVSQKIDVMVEFFDMLDKDGFWEPIKIEMENENKRNGKQL